MIFSACRTKNVCGGSVFWSLWQPGSVSVQYYWYSERVVSVLLVYFPLKLQRRKMDQLPSAFDLPYEFDTKESDIIQIVYCQNVVSAR
jgi:hypothetical protein